ncbi:hypothetical protein M885DRAFT_580357 [Pelagophyceae sp. CCMP2097]|nr:hypothetical protein M885DRAFT_580357 [Pelagophyceae sp. CCMP2097]
MWCGLLVLCLSACCVAAVDAAPRRRASSGRVDRLDDDDGLLVRDAAGRVTPYHHEVSPGDGAALGAVARQAAEHAWARCSSLRAPVEWRVDTKKNTCRFEWPRECAGYLKHFGAGGDVADLFAATHVWLFGNSVVRMLALTLHEMMIRPAKTSAVVDVVIGANSLPNRDDSLWPVHGGASVLFDLNPNASAIAADAVVAAAAEVAYHTAKYANANAKATAKAADEAAAAANADAADAANAALLRVDGAPPAPAAAPRPGRRRLKGTALRFIPAKRVCRTEKCDVDFLACAALCCVARKTKPEVGMDRAAVSFAFTSTPAEGHILDVLQAWASLDCAEALAPEFVVLQMTHGLLPELIMVLDAVNATRNARPAARATTFLVLTQTEVAVVPEDKYSIKFAATHADLVAYEAEAERLAAGYAGVALVLVSSGTVTGIEAGALHHDVQNGWHFKDPGRYYLAQVVLNAMRLDRAKRRLAPDAEGRHRAARLDPPAPAGKAKKAKHARRLAGAHPQRAPRDDR